MWALWTVKSPGRTADLEGGQRLLRSLFRTFLLHFCNYYFLGVRPPHLPPSLFTMGLLHPAPGASDTVWLPWGPTPPSPEGKSNLMPVTTWRLLIHVLAAPGENSQGHTALESLLGHRHRGLSLNWLTSRWPRLILGRTLLTRHGRARPPK